MKRRKQKKRKRKERRKRMKRKRRKGDEAKLRKKPANFLKELAMQTMTKKKDGRENQYQSIKQHHKADTSCFFVSAIFETPGSVPASR